MRRWEESQLSGMRLRAKAPALTQEQFKDLTPEELKALLLGVFIVRDGRNADSP